MGIYPVLRSPKGRAGLQGPLSSSVLALTPRSFTVYLERSILGKLHGQRTLEFHAANGEQMTQLSSEVTMRLHSMTP